MNTGPQDSGFVEDYNAALITRAVKADSVKVHGRYDVECYGPDGKLKWRDVIDNLVVNTGLDDYLTHEWKASAWTSQHYVGLTAGTPTVAAADTMASHGGWTEVTAYSAGTRPDLTAVLGAVSGQSVASSAIAFAINGTATVGGAFICNNSTKGGSTGTLISGGAFSQGNKSVNSGDTLNVTMTLTASGT